MQFTGRCVPWKIAYSADHLFFSSQTKPSHSSYWGGGDLRKAQVDVPLSVSHSCVSSHSWALVVYVFLLLVYVFLDAATLTEVSLCFFLSCKANARV